jgi:Methane oxygenase PmoA
MIKHLYSSLALVLLCCGVVAAQGQITFKQQPNKIEVEIDGQPLATYYYSGEWMKPFLHRVRAASGVIVTRGFPVEKIEGESTDHIWHHGIWYGHGDINGVDFWREFTGDPNQDKKFPLPVGRFVPKSKPAVKSGKGVGSITADYDLVAPDKKVLGSLRQVFSFRRAGGNNLIDAEITISADRGVPLKMGDTEEGSFGLRFADEFKEERGGILTNSEGLKGTKMVWGKRASWVDYSTAIKGEKVGLTIIDHPKNPKHPTYWHARGYGLCGVNPFGEHDFHNDKSRDGSVTIDSGKNLVFRYRVAIHPGEVESVKIDRLIADFAAGK